MERWARQQAVRGSEVGKGPSEVRDDPMCTARGSEVGKSLSETDQNWGIECLFALSSATAVVAVITTGV